jgi:hypothetical protein
VDPLAVGHARRDDLVVTAAAAERQDIELHDPSSA